MPAAPDARLQLREALAGLASADLQQQSAFAAEAVLSAHVQDGPLLEFFLREALRLGDCTAGSVRRMRYRLASRALRTHSAARWSAGGLAAVRDALLARVGLEDNGAAAAELAALAGQLAATCIDAYCGGQYAALGAQYASKAQLQRTWLSELLLVPLLRAACKGPARTRVANACLMAHGVLLELRRWARSAGVLHATVDCLKLALKLTASGALALCAGEALLPVQGCVALLGPRLKAAALTGILHLCTQAMQRGEWQVRKAAADTLAALVQALQPEEGASAAAVAVQVPPPPGEQQQGLAALASLAPAAIAAVEEHLRYDKIPQVRQAAAALLPQLQALPSAAPRAQQQQQQVPAGMQQQPDEDSPGGLTRCRGSLKDVIAQRRRELQESGWQEAGAAVAVQQGSDGAGKAHACHSCSVGSAGSDSIPAWAGLQQQQQQQPAWAGLQQQQVPAAARQDAAPAAAAPRPGCAAVFRAAAAALERLRPLEEEAAAAEAAAAATKRRRWFSLPSSPAKRGSKPAAAAAAARPASQGVPVQVFVPPLRSPVARPRSRSKEEQVWRENPLAQSAEADDGAQHPAAAKEQAATAVQPGAAAVAPCVHHIEHTQFCLRLQAAPPAAELRLANSSGSLPALGAVRFWAQEDGADVGVEFDLAAGPRSADPPRLHRYWLSEGRLQQQHTFPSDGARSEPASPNKAQPAASSPQHTPLPGVPSLPPLQQQARDSGAEAAAAQPAGSPAALPAESPLASLATAALPSFSPDKPAPAPSALRSFPATAASPASASTPGLSTAAAAAAAAGATPSASAPGWHTGSPAAGARSGSPVRERALLPAMANFVNALRAPGEQLLPGLPDWDRSRPGSQGVGGSRGGSAAGSHAGSRPGSPCRASSPSRPPQHAALQQEQQQQQQPQQQLPALPSQHQQQRAPGPLTSMVNRAVSKLQQLHELEEELSLPPGSTMFGGMAVGDSQGRPSGSAAQHSANLRRSLDPALSAIQEASEGERNSGGSGRGHQASMGSRQQRQATSSSGRQRHASTGNRQQCDASTGSRQQASASSGAPAQGMAHLEQLHAQLELNMQEIQRRIDAHHHTGGDGGPDSAGSEDMPAAWDAQDSPPEQQQQQQYAQQHRYAAQQPQRRHWGEPAGRRSLSPPGRGQGEHRLPAERLGSSGSESGSELAAHEGQDAAAGSGGSGTVMLAVCNPLFGSSRPTTAQGMQSINGMLPPKRNLARQRSTSEEEASAAAAAAAAAAPLRQRPSPGFSAGQSLQSLDSGFSALRKESEADAAAFLRGSLPVFAQQQQHRGGAAWRGMPVTVMSTSDSEVEGPGGTSAFSPAPLQAAAAAVAQPIQQRQRLGSLDLAAILGSRPSSPAKFDSRLASPAKLPATMRESSSSEGSGAGTDAAPWQTARSGGGGWHTARERQAASGSRGLWSSSSEGGSSCGECPAAEAAADGSPVAQLQLLRISSRAASPDSGARRSSPASPAARSASPGVAGGGASVADVARQTYPAEALGRLQALRAQLSPTSGSQPQRSAGERSSGGASAGAGSMRTAQATGSGGSASRHAAPPGSAGSGGGSPTALLPQRAVSPEVPGLRISRRHARLLQSAVGRMAGNPGQSCDASDMQAALQDVLERETAHVQAHYQRAAAMRLADLRRQHAHDPAQLAAALRREAPAVEAAQEAATRQELTSFVEMALPRLAELLSSRELLLRCFDAAAEEAGDE